METDLLQIKNDAKEVGKFQWDDGDVELVDETNDKQPPKDKPNE
jgi:hypothetical protein